MYDKNRVIKGRSDTRIWAGFILILASLSLPCATALAVSETSDQWMKEGHELQENVYYEEALGAY